MATTGSFGSGTRDTRNTFAYRRNVGGSVGHVDDPSRLNIDEMLGIKRKTVSVSADVASIVQTLQYSPEFFIHFFLGEQLTHAVPDFHLDVFSEMTHENVLRLVLAIPRAHAKTTLAKLAAVWYLLFSDYRFILYVSGSHDLVVPYVNDIVGFFQSPNYEAVFGPIEKLRWQDGVGIYKFRIPILGNKVCILRGLGAGQRVRGINVDNQRPQLVIADDIEDDENTKNQQLHDGLLNWWVGPFMKCLDQFHNKIIVSGNLTSRTSILYKLLNNPAWRSYLLGCIKADGTPLWPDLWSIEKLIADFREYQDLGKTARWFAEMMNQPVAEGGAIIRAEHIEYKPARTRDDVEFGFITVDPAFSSENWADRAAFCAHAWISREQQWQIVESSLRSGMSAVDIFNDAIQMAARWGFRFIGMETTGQQGGILQLFEHLRYVNNLTQYQFKAIPLNNRVKTERVASFASALSNELGQARYALTQGDFVITQQLLMYEARKRDNDDDAVDCAAHGIIMIDQYLPEIMRSIKGTPLIAGHSIADVADA